VISISMMFVILFLIVCIREATNDDEKLTKAAIAYISDFSANKKDLKEVADIITQQTRDKGGLLLAPTLYDAILFFAYHKVPKSRMILLISAYSYIYPMTKIDTELLLPLLNYINYVSQTDEDLET